MVVAVVVPAKAAYLIDIVICGPDYVSRRLWICNSVFIVLKNSYAMVSSDN